MKNKSLPYVVLLGTFVGSHIVVSRFSVTQFDPITFVTLRMILTALAHLGLYAVLKNRSLPKDPKLWFHAGILGFLGTAMAMTATVSSLKYQSSGVTSLLQTLIPVVTVLLAHVFLKDEPLTLNKGLGVLIAFGGATLLMVNRESGLANLKHAEWRGYILAWLGILGICGGIIYARRFLRAADGFDVASIRIFVAVLAMLTLTMVTNGGINLSRVKPDGYAALLFAAVVGTFLTFLLEFYIIKRFGAAAAAQRSYVAPVAASAMGAIFLGEIVTPVMLIGTILIFAGLIILGRS